MLLVLRVGLAHDGARQVEELVVDGFKETEQAERGGEFVVDGLFENGEEFGKSALESLARALRVGEAKDGGGEGA